MRILLTNDDGIFAPGLVAAYRQLRLLGTIEVVAPASVQSATGHGITLKTPLLTSRVRVEDLFDGVAVDGRPADCVKVAIAQIVAQTPDLVVSGINSGANTGINVLYSGTVAAAIEAAFLGLPAIALSLHLQAHLAADYDAAARQSMEVIRRILDVGIKPGQVMSVNLPALAPGESPAGVRFVRQCTRAWVDTYERRTDPRGADYYWNSSVFSLGASDPDTDVAALRDRYISVTPLQFDLTDHAVLRKWQEIERR